MYLCNAFLKTEVPTVKTLLLRMTKANAYHSIMFYIAQNSNVVGVAALNDKQTVENQRFEIEQFCLREGVQIDGWIEETVSGMIMEILSYCMRRGCQVWTIKDAYKTIFEIVK